MPATLPTLTRTIDDAFVDTWYEVKDETIDNITSATVLQLLLKEKGCFKTQVGGKYITHTIGYGTKSTQKFDKGTVLTQSEPALDTAAAWTWKRFACDITRSVTDDQENAGKYNIKDYLSRRLEAARNACIADFETDLHRWGEYKAAPKQVNGLYDIVAPSSAKTTGSNGSNSDTYNSGTSNGGISRGNTFWQNNVKTGTTPASLNLVPDMRTYWNTVTANMEAPDFIYCSQDLFEFYEDEVADKQQIVRTSFDQKAADLGFETLTFKGATMTWSASLPTIATNSLSEMFFLNSKYIELYYDPSYWFDMTNWKESTNQLERVAYILCVSSGLITTQPRRHGYLSYTA